MTLIKKIDGTTTEVDFGDIITYQYSPIKNQHLIVVDLEDPDEEDNYQSLGIVVRPDSSADYDFTISYKDVTQYCVLIKRRST